MKTMLITAVVLLVVAALLLAGCQATRAGYESAPYEVVRSEGKFELRDYPALTVVETAMAAPDDRNDAGGNSGGDSGGDAKGDADKSFKRLFGFITGGNEAEQKISMTTPVFMTEGDAARTMAFVMPAKMKAGEVPRPTDDSVTVRELDAGRFAVLRFSGGRSAEREAEALERLKAWMKAEGLIVSSPPVYGYFDPPWTPGFLRRNEVMVQTSPGTQ